MLAHLTIYLHEETIITESIDTHVVIAFPSTIAFFFNYTHCAITIEVKAVQLIIEIIIVVINKCSQVYTFARFKINWNEFVIVISVDYETNFIFLVCSWITDNGIATFVSKFPSSYNL